MLKYIVLIAIVVISVVVWNRNAVDQRKVREERERPEKLRAQQVEQAMREYAARQAEEQAAAPIRTLKKERFSVAGTYYHMPAINKLAKANPDWRKGGKTLAEEGKVMEKVPHYTYMDRPINLEPEPTNEYDKNAIKVIIAGEHVGYIGQDDNVHVGEILRFGDIKYITAQFRGGEYKVVSADGSVETMDDHVGITLHIGYV